MKLVSGVMLMPLESISYRQHVAKQTFLSKSNAAEKTPDFRAVSTGLVEDQVRAVMRRHFTETKYRVLRWEEIDRARRRVVHYKELDGVFKTSEGVTVVLEVKASTSRKSLANGMKQLRSSLSTLLSVDTTAIGVLVVANLGAFVEGFGTSEIPPDLNMAVFDGVESSVWPFGSDLSLGKSVFYFSQVPDDVASAWVDDIGEGDPFLD